jgi:predicted outer membrane repeat protein
MIQRHQSRRRTRPSAAKPWLTLQTLDDRIVPASFVVTSPSGGTGAGTLHNAITLLNSSTDPTNTITFNLTQPATINLTADLPSIAKPVVIQGPSTAANLTISGASARRVFDTTAADAETEITFDQLTISNGNTTSTTTGGGLTIGDEFITIRNSVVQNNTAPVGGGIQMTGQGKLAIESSRISGNSANTTGSFYGGGGIFIFASATVSLTDSTISGNTSDRNGGGIHFYNNFVAVDILRSTISGNVAKQGNGGGLYSIFGNGAITLTNSTVSGNTARSSGGGLAFYYMGGTALIQNSTIASNTANSAGNLSGITGGGLSFEKSAGSIEVVSTILAGNVNINGTSGDLYANPSKVLITNSAYTDGSGFTFDSGSTKNIATTTAALNLSPLNFHSGGTTKTMPPGPGSVAINNGSNLISLITDQNGAAREQPAGFPDIGSVEATPSADPTASATFTTITTSSLFYNTNNYEFTVKYVAAPGDKINTATLGADISVTGPGGYSQTSALVSFTDPNGNQTEIIAKYSIPANPLGAPVWDNADIGTYSAAMLASAVKSVAGLAVPSGPLGTFKVVAPATFTVSNANNSGAGSLRDAVARANDNSPAFDTINFDPAFFTGGLKTITLTTALDAITDLITIIGPGAQLAAISGNNAVRVLDFTPAPDTGNYSITGLAIQNGSTTGSGGGIAIGNQNVWITDVNFLNNTASQRGGAITIGSTADVMITGGIISGNRAAAGAGIAVDAGSTLLTVSNTAIASNTATNAGGGIDFTLGGKLTVFDASFTGNKAQASNGGAIAFFGTTTGFSITGASFTNNSAASDGGAVYIAATNGSYAFLNTVFESNTASVGGGLAHAFTEGVTMLHLSNTRIAGNSAGIGGGIVQFKNEHATNFTLLNSSLTANSGGGFVLQLNTAGVTSTVTIRNSTLSSNSGGGAVIVSNVGNLTTTIQNSTIAFNSAASGGGVAHQTNTGVTTFTLESTIVSGNTGGAAPDLVMPATTILNVTRSAIGSTAGYIINGTNSNNLPTADSNPTSLALGPLQNNGGTTLSHNLGPNSKAISAGSNPTGLTTDQRGGAFTRLIGAAVDIGAIEAQPAAPSVTGLLINGNSGFSNLSRSRILTVEVTFAANVTAGVFDALNAVVFTRLNSNVSSSGPVVASGVASGSVGRVNVAQGAPNSIILTFVNANGAAITSGVEYGSLTDGRWELAIASSGYNSTTSGVNPAMLRRLYGDTQNDGTVDGTDLVVFGNAFGTANVQLDFDANGTIDGADLSQFGNRFGLTF